MGFSYNFMKLSFQFFCLQNQQAFLHFCPQHVPAPIPVPVLQLYPQVHPQHVPVLLLAGHGQQLCQPPRLLLDEQKVERLVGIFINDEFWVQSVLSHLAHLTCFSKNRPLADSFIESRCQFIYHSVCLSVCPFSRSIFWGLFCPHFPKSDVQYF